MVNFSDKQNQLKSIALLQNCTQNRNDMGIKRIEKKMEKKITKV